METIFATAITLFLIMDPLGNVPVFLVVLSPVKEERRRRIILRELLIALAVMLIFLLAGPSMLRAIGADDYRHPHDFPAARQLGHGR